MRRRGLILGVALWALFTPPLTGGPRRSESPPFPVGEHLRYAISWAQYLVAGEMALAVRGQGHFFDRVGLHLELRARTIGPVRTLVKALDEQWTSYVDPETWLPYRVEHWRQEGDRRTDLTITLDHRQRIARLSTGGTIPISSETRDVVAFLYYLRTLPLEPGSRHRFSLLSENRRLLVQVHVLPRASIQTRAGRFEAIGMALRLQGQKAAKESHLQLWLSADERRLPVLITAREAFGEIRVELVEAVAGVTTAPASTVRTERMR